MRYAEVIVKEQASAAPRIVPIQGSDETFILRQCVAVFRDNGMPNDQIRSLIIHATDWNISKKLVMGGQIIGFYLFGEGSVIGRVGHCEQKEDLSQYANKRGVEGIALVVLPKYRGRGYGEMLKNVPRTMGYDYVFGQQLKTLNNLPQWLKHRRLVADCGDAWVTLEDL